MGQYVIFYLRSLYIIIAAPVAIRRIIGSRLPVFSELSPMEILGSGILSDNAAVINAEGIDRMSISGRNASVPCPA